MGNKRANRWHAMPVEDVLRAFSVNRYTGLSERTAGRRRGASGSSLWIAESPSVISSVLSSVLDYATILFLLTIGLTAFFDKNNDVWGILSILILSIALRAGTCLISRAILLRARRYKLPRCRVMRDGQACYLFADQVVEGDILLFSPGDTVVCDTRLISGELEVSETYFSGNRRCIRKNSADTVPENSVWWERSNTLFAASTVIGGSAVGVAIAAGERTYAYACGGYIRIEADDDTATIRRIARWSKNVSLWMILISVVLLFVGIFASDRRMALAELFLSILALTVASMGEFLNTAAAAFFACSIQLLQTETNGACRVKSLQAAERMGNADWIVFSSERLFLSGHLTISSWMREDGHVQRVASDDPMPREVENYLSLLLRCTGANQSLDVGGEHRRPSDLHTYLSALCASYPHASIISSHAACLESVTCHALCTAHISEDNATYACVCGSVEDVLRCCSRIQIHGGAQHLSREMYASLMAYAHEERAHNRRTIAIARRLSPFQDLSMPSAVQYNMTFLGCFSVSNALEVNGKTWIEQCRSGEMRTVVFCEDAESAEYIAKEVGLLAEQDIVCTGVDSVSDALESRDRGNLLVQIPASDREAVLREIQNHARGVVYVGDKLADLPCLKQSASIAVERSADTIVESLSRRADAIIHHRNQVGCCPGSGGASDAYRMVAFSRNALANLRCASMYLLITQSLRIVLMLVAVLTDLPLPSPASILFLGCILDCFSILLIAFRKPKQNVFTLTAEQLMLPGWTNGILAAVGMGVLSGMLISLSVLLCRNLSWIFDPNAILAVQLISTVVVSVVTVYTCRAGGKSPSGVRARAGSMNLVYLLTAAAILFILVHRCVSRFAVVDWRVWLLVMLPSAVVFVMMKLYNRS